VDLGTGNAARAVEPGAADGRPFGAAGEPPAARSLGRGLARPSATDYWKSETDSPLFMFPRFWNVTRLMFSLMLRTPPSANR